MFKSEIIKFDIWLELQQFEVNINSQFVTC